MGKLEKMNWKSFGLGFITGWFIWQFRRKIIPFFYRRKVLCFIGVHEIGYLWESIAQVHYACVHCGKQITISQGDYY